MGFVQTRKLKPQDRYVPPDEWDCVAGIVVRRVPAPRRQTGSSGLTQPEDFAT